MEANESACTQGMSAFLAFAKLVWRAVAGFPFFFLFKFLLSIIFLIYKLCV
jgi:hypothetical protein